MRAHHLVAATAAATLVACSSTDMVSVDPPAFEVSRFSDGATNPFFPLVPGTAYRYDGVTDDGNEIDSVVVTADTKMILGGRTTVVHDRVWTNGDLTEDTFDWYAADREGNIWYFGEDTKELDHGKVVSTQGSWEAGKNGGKAGIVMEAHPKVGDTYREE